MCTCMCEECVRAREEAARDSERFGEERRSFGYYRGGRTERLGDEADIISRRAEQKQRIRYEREDEERRRSSQIMARNIVEAVKRTTPSKVRGMASQGYRSEIGACMDFDGCTPTDRQLALDEIENYYRSQGLTVETTVHEDASRWKAKYFLIKW